MTYKCRLFLFLASHLTMTYGCLLSDRLSQDYISNGVLFYSGCSTLRKEQGRKECRLNNLCRNMFPVLMASKERQKPRSSVSVQRLVSFAFVLLSYSIRANNLFESIKTMSSDKCHIDLFVKSILVIQSSAWVCAVT